jgi:hypothetical protein
MQNQTLVEKLKQGPVDFNEVMATIDAEYNFTPCEFRNGDQLNEAGSNNGSCKIFAFAQLQQLDQQATLNAFGDFYTKDVLENPEGNDHGNIRNFMREGWAGIHFSGTPLQPK